MRRRGITFKIFVVTTILLIISALCLYLTLYFFLPSFYYHTKKAGLAAGVDTLVARLGNSNWDEAESLLDDFGYRQNARVTVEDREGKLVYPHFYAVPIKDFIGNDPSITSPPHASEKTGDSPVIVQKITIPPLSELSSNPDKPDKIEEFRTTSSIVIGGDDMEYTLTISASLQPIDEATSVIWHFLPYIFIVILLISFVGAYVYSRFITRPLICLNILARKMARLDFTDEVTIHSNDEIGELAGSLGKLSRDLQRSLTELHDANAQLTDDIQRKEEQEQQRREFIATISHELKTPLTAVSGQLEAMIHQIGPYRNRDKYLLQSHNIVKEMEKLVHEILDLSKQESREFKPQIQAVNATLLVKNLLHSYEYFCEMKQIKLVGEIDPGVIVQADERLLSKAVSNVVGNAVQYTREGEQVSVCLRQSDDYVHMEVLNTGAHIEEDELPLLFNPFYRLEKSRSRAKGGSGLGLYIVQKVLEAHGAEYKLVNTPDGVQFTIRFTKTGNA